MNSHSTLHTSHSHSTSRLPWLLFISAVVILLDRLSKNWVRQHIELGQAIPVIPKVFRITHVLNDGAAFSLFADSATPEHVRWGLIAFSTAAALAVLIALLRMGRNITLTTLALAFVLGGAIGNDYDRKAWESFVRQMVAANLLYVDIEGHGSMKMTAEGNKFLKERENIPLRLPRKATKESRVARDKAVGQRENALFTGRDREGQR